MKKATLTIGIPAFNEEQNIGHLLVSILNQKLEHCVLSEVLIVSDGSTDKTAETVKKINDRRIRLVIHKKRRGLNTTENEIVKRAKSDVLVMLNADILLVGDAFLESVTEPLLRDKRIGIVGVRSRATRPMTFIERVFGNSHVLKTRLYEEINNGNNVYTCYGVARAFSRAYYTKLRWPKDCPEDSYSYLLAKKLGFAFHYAPKAQILFRSPATLRDHIRQSSRFQNGQKVLRKLFGEEVVKKEFYIPPLTAIRVFLSLLPGRALSLPSYIIIQAYTRLFAHKKYSFADKHEIAISTKRLVSYSLVAYSLIEKL